MVLGVEAICAVGIICAFMLSIRYREVTVEDITTEADTAIKPPYVK
ncbi:MAG TPA: hypothetical protein VGE97_09640 [Nitrososphaera sp.]